MRLLPLGLIAVPLLACSAGIDDSGSGGAQGGSGPGTGSQQTGPGTGGSSGTFMGTGGMSGCVGQCSSDLHQVLCEGQV